MGNPEREHMYSNAPLQVEHTRVANAIARTGHTAVGLFVSYGFGRKGKVSRAEVESVLLALPDRLLATDIDALLFGLGTDGQGCIDLGELCRSLRSSSSGELDRTSALT